MKKVRLHWFVFARRLLIAFAGFAASMLIAGFFATALVRLAPGFGVDERELDARLSAESQRAAGERPAVERNVVSAYLAYLYGLRNGDLGVSFALNRPVADLIAERAPETGWLVATGLFAGWAVALVAASSATIVQSPFYRILTAGSGGILLCAPSALITFLVMMIGAPAALGIAAVVFPRVLRYASDLFHSSERSSFVLAARARGLSRTRLFTAHIATASLPGLIAITGVSFNIAVGASIPIEVLCDRPGLGQLAWKAALGRDLPVLINVTLMISAVTLLANRAADLVISAVDGTQR